MKKKPNEIKVMINFGMILIIFCACIKYKNIVKNKASVAEKWPCKNIIGMQKVRIKILYLS